MGGVHITKGAFGELEIDYDEYENEDDEESVMGNELVGEPVGYKHMETLGTSLRASDR